MNKSARQWIGGRQVYKRDLFKLLKYLLKYNSYQCTIIQNWKGNVANLAFCT